MRVTEAVALTLKEYHVASTTHPPFNSSHEGYAVVLEELDELWGAIKQVKSFSERNDAMKAEAIQVGAMALRFLVDLIDEVQVTIEGEKRR